MATKQKRRRRLRLNFQLTSSLDKPLLRGGVVPLLARHPISVAAERISRRHAIQEIEFTFARQAAKGAVTDFCAFLEILARLQMIAHQRQDLRAHVVAIERMNVQPVKKT